MNFVDSTITPTPRDSANLIPTVPGGENYLRFPDVRDGWYVNAKRRAWVIDKTFPEFAIYDFRHRRRTSRSARVERESASADARPHLATMTLDMYTNLFDDDLDAFAFPSITPRRNQTRTKPTSQAMPKH